MFAPQRNTPSEKSHIPRGYRPVIRIAKKARTVTTISAKPTNINANSCGMISSHLTKISNRLRCSEYSTSYSGKGDSVTTGAGAIVPAIIGGATVNSPSMVTVVTELVNSGGVSPGEKIGRGVPHS